MAIAVSTASAEIIQTLQGAYLRRARLLVTGLAAGNNPVAHGLPAAPRSVAIEPTSAGPFNEYQAADATNVYLNAGGAGTTCTLAVEY